MPRAEPTIANYDAQTAEEITQRLRKLSQADLAKLEAYEKQGQARTTVLDAISALRGDAPWSGYDDMDAEEVNDALKGRNGDAVRRVLDYERQHKGRTTIIEFAKRRQDESDGASAGAPRPQSSSKSSSRPKRSAGKSPSASTRKASTSKSTGGRPRKAASSTTRAKTRSQPSATRSTPSRQMKSASGGSGRRSRPSAASRTPSAAKSSESESPAREALQAASASTTRVMEALQSAKHAVGSAAHESRQAVGTAVKDTGLAVAAGATSGARSAKRKSGPSNGSVRTTSSSDARSSRNATGLTATAKDVAGRSVGPALAVAAATTGVLALKSRRRRRKVLGITLPRSSELEVKSLTKSLGKASKQFGKTWKNVSSDIERVGDQAERIGNLVDLQAEESAPAARRHRHGLAGPEGRTAQKDQALMKAGLVAGGLAGLTAGSAGISSRRRRQEGARRFVTGRESPGASRGRLAEAVRSLNEGSALLAEAQRNRAEPRG
jgi:hypothetical protein